MNKKTGEISGKMNEEMDYGEYEIECKQMKIKKIFRLILRVRVIFSEIYKSNGIRLIDERTLECCDDRFNHCYLNAKLENGIYYFKYRCNPCINDSPYFGVSTIRNYIGYDLYNHQSSNIGWCF